MDDDFNAAPGTTYSIVVTLTDEYGQTQSRSFHWQFNTASSGIRGAVASGAVPLGASGAGFPASGQHPTTQTRSDHFSVDDFWQNVEKLPGGQAAENWLASRNGQVQWGWTLLATRGRRETQADGSIVPVVHIPWWDNNPDAVAGFVHNITQDWVTGFAAESLIPYNGGPADWQAYIKERNAAQRAVVVAGAELYLSGYSAAYTDVSKTAADIEAAIAVLTISIIDPFAPDSVDQTLVQAAATGDPAKVVAAVQELEALGAVTEESLVAARAYAVRFQTQQWLAQPAKDLAAEASRSVLNKLSLDLAPKFFGVAKAQIVATATSNGKAIGLLFGHSFATAKKVLDSPVFVLPKGLTKSILEAYWEVARQAIAKGVDVTGVQAIRIQIIEKILNSGIVLPP